MSCSLWVCLPQARALKALVQLFSLVLGSFQTTAAEDAAALAALAPAAEDVHMAIAFRMEKKRTLVDAIRALAVRIKVRATPEPLSFSISVNFNYSRYRASHRLRALPRRFRWCCEWGVPLTSPVPQQNAILRTCSACSWPLCTVPVR